MTQKHSYEYGEGDPSAELDRLAKQFAREHDVPYAEALQSVVDEHPELGTAYTGLEAPELQEPETGEAYMRRREVMADAGAEVDKRAQAYCREHQVGYTQALKQVFAADPALAARYARGE